MKNKILFTSMIVMFCLIGKAQTPPPPPPDSTRHSNNDASEVFTYAETMPEFIGEGGIAKYLRDSIKYPQIEKEAGKQGVVYVSFVIEKDGSISEVKVARGVDGAPGLSKEAVRVISKMPNWKPGILDGQPVRIQYTQPIRFVLQEDDNSKKKKRK
ncbi:hypothetical protein BH09BAC5_BH09BAC5_28440 [soil metagenome]